MLNGWVRHQSQTGSTGFPLISSVAPSMGRSAGTDGTPVVGVTRARQRPKTRVRSRYIDSRTATASASPSLGMDRM